MLSCGKVSFYDFFQEIQRSFFTHAFKIENKFTTKPLNNAFLQGFVDDGNGLFQSVQH